MYDNVVYTSIPQVLASCSSLEAQLALIDTILVGMLAAMSEANASGQFAEYKLDTGQTKTEIRYTSLDELQKSYAMMFRTRQTVQAQLNYNKTGRVFSVIPSKNFNGGGYGYGFNY